MSGVRVVSHERRHFAVGARWKVRSLVSWEYYIEMAITHGNTPVNTLCEVRDAVLEIMVCDLHNI